MATRNAKSTKRSTAGRSKPAANGHATAPKPPAIAAASATAEDIRIRAYELFMARGATHGDDLADWFLAEQELNR